jgi:hypothetical protein
MTDLKITIIHQDEVSVIDGGVEYHWWRGVVEVAGGTRYFNMALPPEGIAEGDRMEFLRKALAKKLQ